MNATLLIGELMFASQQASIKSKNILEDIQSHDPEYNGSPEDLMKKFSAENDIHGISLCTNYWIQMAKESFYKEIVDQLITSFGQQSTMRKRREFLMWLTDYYKVTEQEMTDLEEKFKFLCPDCSKEYDHRCIHFHKIINSYTGTEDILSLAMKYCRIAAKNECLEEVIEQIVGDSEE